MTRRTREKMGRRKKGETRYKKKGEEERSMTTPTR